MEAIDNQDTVGATEEPVKVSKSAGGIKKGNIGLGVYNENLFRRGLIDKHTYFDFIAQNEGKEAALEARKLPQSKVYGFFKDSEEIKQKVNPEEGDRFIARCKNKESKEEVIERAINVDFETACKFIDELPGGPDKWKIELKEYAPAIAAGSILVERSGLTIIETWYGAHYRPIEEPNCPKFSAIYDPTNVSTTASKHFVWNKPKWAKQKELEGIVISEYATKALRYLFSDLKPKPDQPVYAEFCVKKNGDIYFIDVNDSPILVGKEPPEVVFDRMLHDKYYLKSTELKELEDKINPEDFPNLNWPTEPKNSPA